METEKHRDIERQNQRERERERERERQRQRQRQDRENIYYLYTVYGLKKLEKKSARRNDVLLH